MPACALSDYDYRLTADAVFPFPRMEAQVGSLKSGLNISYNM
jgi:hypothetical protein